MDDLNEHGWRPGARIAFLTAGCSMTALALAFLLFMLVHP